MGASTHAADGYDALTLADDAATLLDVLEEGLAAVVGIDAGAPPAFMLAMHDAGRVCKLVVMESLLGTLPGAEDFLAGGPPWWFGFHAVPGLAESVLKGHEREYIGWFLASGTGHHLLGRLGPTLLLETGVVVSGHGREVGDLFAPETRDATPRSLRQSHILRLQSFAASTQEVG